MRLALISDIHSNLVALRAVLADIRRTGVDQIICLGDVVNLGPEPKGVIEILAELGCPCIMGNHDEFLLDPKLVLKYSESSRVIASVDWCRNRLSSDELQFVRGFQRHHEIPFGRGSKLLLFHGSPRSNTEDLLATTSADALDDMLDGTTAGSWPGDTHISRCSANTTVFCWSIRVA